MAIWPHEETPLTEPEKAAYRYLLYQAMLDIRILCQSRGPESRNPLEWRRQYRLSRVAGAIADWLHNLARCSVNDFHSFNVHWFWQEYDSLCGRFREFSPGSWLDYRHRYNEHLARLKKE
ncbi:MAG: hypothetical protein ACRYFS_09300 [Janthinobacterium lividum]